MTNTQDLEQICQQMRRNILEMTTSAGSGHPTSSLSAVELMATLFFGGFFNADFENFQAPNNDRLIFSKGHASPLFYALYCAKGKLSKEELMQFRKFNSKLEGHPTPRFEYTEATTGSLGQGLGIGVGMGLSAKMDKLDYKTWVLLGDSELAEGSVWEAMNSASFYKLNNLIAVVDMNRLGQRGETQMGWQTEILTNKAQAFGWQTLLIENGHNLEKIQEIYEDAMHLSQNNHEPIMIIAKTIKGKGVSFLENQDGWHGKALSEEQLGVALEELG